METKCTGAFGADIVAEKSELVYGVQCNWHGKPGGVSASRKSWRPVLTMWRISVPWCPALNTPMKPFSWRGQTKLPFSVPVP